MTPLIIRILDSNGDGWIEIADLPGVLAKLASLKAGGVALINAILALAALGKVSAPTGDTITADMVAEAWEQAKSPYLEAAERARIGMGGGQ